MIKNNKYILLLLIFVVFLEFYKIPYNSYLVIKRPFEERMIRNYGYCDKEGYGFIQYIIKNYNIKTNLTIINKYQSPGISSLLKLSSDKKNNNIILINFKETKQENILDKKIKQFPNDENYIDISKFNLIYRYGNCYYLKKNND